MCIVYITLRTSVQAQTHAHARIQTRTMISGRWQYGNGSGQHRIQSYIVFCTKTINYNSYCWVLFPYEIYNKLTILPKVFCDHQSHFMCINGKLPLVHRNKIRQKFCAHQTKNSSNARAITVIKVINIISINPSLCLFLASKLHPVFRLLICLPIYLLCVAVSL